MPFPPGTAHPIPVLAEMGWISVDFFFAISGFVICMQATRPDFRPLSFIVRRAFRLYPLWIATSLIYLFLTRYLGRAPHQTDDFFLYSLTLLPTNGFPFYDLGWSLQHEMLFYVLAAVMTPWLGLRGLVAFLAAGLAADHLFDLPWYLHQYFLYYGNFLAGIAAFLVRRNSARLGFVLPLLVGGVALHWAPSRAFFPFALFCWLVAFVNLHAKGWIGRLGVELGNASYSIYLIHPLVFNWVYIQLRPPLPPNWVQEPLRYGALITVCVLACLSWRTFERPMNWIGEKISSASRAGSPQVS